MSKAVKLSVGILAGLLLISVVMAMMSSMQNQKLKKENLSLTDQLAAADSFKTKMGAKLKKLENNSKELTKKIQQKEQERAGLQSQYDQINSQMQGLQAKIDQANSERDDWKRRVTTIRKERDELMVKLKDRPEKIVEKIVYKDPEPTTQGPAPELAQGPSSAVPGMVPPAMSEGETTDLKPDNVQNEEYWAQLLRDKARLQIKIGELEKELDQKTIEIIDLKKVNSDYELEIAKLTNTNKDIKRKIKHGDDLANNLSVELARAKNEQKFIATRAQDVKVQNNELRTQVKQLATKEQALKRSMSRLSEEKKFIEKKLIETEQVIQSRIDQIWNIKQDLDQRFKSSPVASQSKEVELPPIVISSGGSTRDMQMAARKPMGSMVEAKGSPMEDKGSAAGPMSMPQTQLTPGLPGKVMSINEENNFVIIDKGATSGLNVGDVFSVYRGQSLIGEVELIQVRRQIAAADIKQAKSKFQAGDTVR